jgi:hypothetical protein
MLWSMAAGTQRANKDIDYSRSRALSYLRSTYCSHAKCTFVAQITAQAAQAIHWSRPAQTIARISVVTAAPAHVRIDMAIMSRILMRCALDFRVGVYPFREAGIDMSGICDGR